MKVAARHRAPTDAAGKDYYLELVQAFPLKHLRSDRQLSKAIKMIDSLIVRGKLERGEKEYLDVLTNIVEKYETENSFHDARSFDAKIQFTFGALKPGSQFRLTARSTMLSHQ
jgi:hypothetical protein